MLAESWDDILREVLMSHKLCTVGLRLKATAMDRYIFLPRYKTGRDSSNGLYRLRRLKLSQVTEIVYLLPKSEAYNTLSLVLGSTM